MVLLAVLGLAVASYRLGDAGETRRAGLEVMRLDPQNQEVRAVLDQIDRSPGGIPPGSAPGGIPVPETPPSPGPR